MDARDSPYTDAGFPPGGAPAGGRLTTGFAQAIIPLREAEIRLYVYRSATLYTVWYARTNAIGQYVIAWTDNSTPVKLKVAVIARRPNLTTVSATTTPPTFEFAVGGRAGTVLDSRDLTTGLLGNRVEDFNITQPSDTVNAFLTARETYAMFSVQGDGVVGGSVRDAMDGVVIRVHPMPLPGITPTDSQIFLNIGVPTDRPFTAAHELGHALAWRSLGLAFPIIQPTDYLCLFPGRPDAFPGWNDFSFECEKVAFHEALANLTGALWMWRRDSTNRILPRAPDPWGLEGVGTCAEGPDEENRPACNTRALWDVVDTPNDAVDDRDLSDVVSVLRSYPDDCPCADANHCANEGYVFDLRCPINDVDGSNWKDFKANYVELFGQAAEMDGIEAWNGLSAQTED